MLSRWAFSSPEARRRWVACGLIAVVALAAGALVAAGHNSSGNSHAVSDVGTKALPHRVGGLPLTSHRGWRRHRGPVPILMYHVVERPRPGVRNPLLYVSGRTFAAQINWLDRHGFQAVTLDQVENAWFHGERLPPRPIVVSFDDGYLSQYRTAMPTLRRHGWAGVLSLALGNMKPGGPITPTDVERMIRAGWELASHTISHLDVRRLPPKRLRHEVWDSRRILRYVFRVPVDNFTYPAGLFDARAVRAVKAAGYRGALTVSPGLANADQRYQLRRIRVLDSMGVGGLAAELSSLGVWRP